MPISTDLTPLLERAQRIGMKQSNLAELSGLPVSSFNRAANHLADLCYQDWRIVERVVLSCEELTRRAGQRLDWKDFAIAKKALAAYEDELRNPPAPPDEQDWKLLAMAIVEDPSTLAMKMGVSVKDLLVRLDESSRRFDVAIHGLRKSTREMDELLEANLVEHQERTMNQRFQKS